MAADDPNAPPDAEDTDLHCRELRFGDIPPGLMLIGGVIVVKALDQDGNMIYLDRSSGDLTAHEVLGAMTIVTDRIRWVMRKAILGE